MTSVRSGFLNLGTNDFCDWLILRCVCMGGVAGAGGCLAASLASTNQMPGTSPTHPVVTTKLSPDFAKCPLRAGGRGGEKPI